VPIRPNQEQEMNAKLQDFLGFLDLLAEGQRRQAELVSGRRFEAELQPVGERGRVVKFPLTGHQKGRLFHAGKARKVPTTH
jgi:hypothetical protein